VLIEEGMVENAHAMGTRFLAGLRQINSPAVKEVRGRGLMIAIELHPQAGRPAVLRRPTPSWRPV